MLSVEHDSIAEGYAGIDNELILNFHYICIHSKFTETFEYIWSNSETERGNRKS